MSNSRDIGVGRERIWIAAIFASALVLRLLHLQQIAAHDPYFELPSIDGRIYHAWALDIRDGKWLRDSAFFMGPLYPYFLGVVYIASGGSILAAKALQAVIGAVGCVLLWVLGRRVFDARTGLLAAAMMAVYAMFPFYEGSLLLVNLLVPLTLVLLLLVDRLHERGTLRTAFGAGILLGLCALARQNALLFAPLEAAWIFFDFRGRESRIRRAALIAVFASGTLAAIAPATLHNYLASGDFVWINAAGGAPFYTGNNPSADGTFKVAREFPRERAGDPDEQKRIYREVAERNLGRTLAESEVSAYWVGRALDWIVHNPSDWLALEGRKLALFFNRNEVSNNRPFSVDREFSWVMRLPLLGFGAVAPLGIVGLALTRRAARRLAPLYMMLGVYLASALLFFVLSRYRMPIVPIWLLFAAASLVQGGRWLRAREIRSLGIAIGAGTAAAIFVAWPIGNDDLASANFNLANRYRELEQWDLAISRYREAISHDPDYLSAWNNLALACEARGGKDEEAIAAWQQVLALSNARERRRYAARAREHLQRLSPRGELRQRALP